MTEELEIVEEEEEVLYCTVHPNVETTLRCNKCNRPMCIRCAVRTPVGYRCKQCMRQQQAVFYTTESRDIWVAGAVAFVTSALLAGVLLAINFLILTLFLSAPAGGLISEMVHRATDKRRGRYTWLAVALATTAGALPIFVLKWGPDLSGGMLPNWYDMLSVALYVGLAATTAAARFRYR